MGDVDERAPKNENEAGVYWRKCDTCTPPHPHPLNDEAENNLKPFQCDPSPVRKPSTGYDALPIDDNITPPAINIGKDTSDLKNNTV